MNVFLYVFLKKISKIPLNKLIIDCGLTGEVDSTHTFLNFIFQLGKADIPARSTKQLDEIADEIVFLLDGKIYFKGSVNQLKEQTEQSNLEHAIAKLISKQYA